jgi:signal transduction histidine kinase
MESALASADEVMAEGRDRVVNLHSCFEKAGDLAASLARAGDELANGSEVKVSVTAEGHAQTLDPLAADEIYCIGREAIVNAIRHSKGRSVEVEVDYAAYGLRLRIRDDGSVLTRKFCNPGGPDTSD